MLIPTIILKNKFVLLGDFNSLLVRKIVTDDQFLFQSVFLQEDARSTPCKILN